MPFKGLKTRTGEPIEREGIALLEPNVVETLFDAPYPLVIARLGLNGRWWYLRAITADPAGP